MHNFFHKHSRNLSNLYSFLIAAGGRRIRHGTELRDSGRTEHQAYAGIARSLPAQSPGKQRVLRPPRSN